jgi:hypothetical protein
VFYAEKDTWYLRGFDYMEKIWKKLPLFGPPIPAPNSDLFKDFHIARNKGFICVNAEKASEAKKLCVCNVLTGETSELPSLEYSRHLVIVHVHVTLAKNYDIFTSSFLVVVVGNVAIGIESLSRKTNVFDFAKGQWKATGDVPRADFLLNNC